MSENEDWGRRAGKGFLASGIDPGDRGGHKNEYIDLLQKTALDEVLDLKGDEIVLDFGCGSGRMSYWIAPRVKRVLGLEVTSEMIDLAEQNRASENVEFRLYDGAHFPVFPDPFDLILSVGVLLTMRGEALLGTISQLALTLKREGKMVLIEQASDHPKVGRPRVGEYLDAFKGSGMACLRHYPIRRGRWWLLYLIRYGIIPRSFFPRISKNELRGLRSKKGPISYYRDHLFYLVRK